MKDMDHDGDTLNEIVLPLMAVPRLTKAQRVNRYEPQPQKIFITSAGVKGSFAYHKLIECLEDSIIQPKTTFVWSLDYRVPLIHGLLNEQFINEIKLSPTYNEDSFAREFLGYWTGVSSDSWFDYNKVNNHRKIVNPETTRKIKENSKGFYLLSVDVGRVSDQTVVTVIKVLEHNGLFVAYITNIIVLGLTKEEKHFARQTLAIKRLIAAFQPKEVVIDANGLGVGLLDFMIQESTDDDGTIYPPVGVINDDDYRRIQPVECESLIYMLKADNSLNSQMHGNCLNRISAGKVFFLISEQEAKSKLLATKAGAKMGFVDRKKRLMPHELTTKLIDEMMNLKLKGTGNSFTIALEKINTKMGKDKFSSLEMGLWRVKELEDESLKKFRRKQTRNRQLVFYTQRG
jgi:hypothetical protein